MRSVLRTAVWLLAAMYAGAGQAATLIEDTNVALPGTTSAAEPQLAGTIIADLTQAFSFSAYGGTVSGAVQSRVVRSDVDGTLDFYWRVFNDANSAGDLSSFRLGAFMAPQYEANWRIDGLGEVSPVSARLFGGVYAGQGYVNFNFQRFDDTGARYGLRAGESSNFFFLDTTAVNFARTAIYDLANLGHTEISSLYETFAPSQVPTPGTLALIALGLAGAIGQRRRRAG